MNKQIAEGLRQIAAARAEAATAAGYICKHCGKAVTRYGPETFHTGSQLIFCQFGGTKAEAVLDGDV